MSGPSRLRSTKAPTHKDEERARPFEAPFATQGKQGKRAVPLRGGKQQPRERREIHRTRTCDGAEVLSPQADRSPLSKTSG